MPSYDAESKEFVNRDWLERYPPWAVADTRWFQQRPPWEWPEDLDRAQDLGTQDVRFADHRKPLACPRLFVSYRQYNRDYALRIAFIAKTCGFDFWLDVRDPSLLQLKKHKLTPAQRAVATAMAIEMGLLNSSHVIAVMTGQARGTLWIPYEYGRVKDGPPTSVQAGCWRHPALPPSDFAEYLLLGTITLNETDIRKRLAAELTEWAKNYRTCGGGSTQPWAGGPTMPLP